MVFSRSVVSTRPKDVPKEDLRRCSRFYGSAEEDPVTGITPISRFSVSPQLEDSAGPADVAKEPPARTALSPPAAPES